VEKKEELIINQELFLPPYVLNVINTKYHIEHVLIVAIIEEGQ
jgi:hypothetical protein